LQSLSTRKYCWYTPPEKTPLLLKTSKLSFYYFLDHFNTLNDATWTTAALYMPGVKPVEEIQACMFPAKNFGR
jgi:hypothetical protein